MRNTNQTQSDIALQIQEGIDDVVTETFALIS